MKVSFRSPLWIVLHHDLNPFVSDFRFVSSVCNKFRSSYAVFPNRSRVFGGCSNLYSGEFFREISDQRKGRGHLGQGTTKQSRRESPANPVAWINLVLIDMMHWVWCLCRFLHKNDIYTCPDPSTCPYIPAPTLLDPRALFFYFVDIFCHTTTC